MASAPRIICLNRSVLDFMAGLLSPEISSVLEIGGGWSSRWFAQRCRNLVTVETNHIWRRRIKADLADADCANILMFPSLAEIETLGLGVFDLALVDCAEGQREEAAKKAWPALARDGWLIFDDAQRPQHQKAIEWLNEQGGDPIPLRWQEGDVESARERLALAWPKP